MQEDSVADHVQVFGLVFGECGDLHEKRRVSVENLMGK